MIVVFMIAGCGTVPAPDNKPVAPVEHSKSSDGSVIASGVVLSFGIWTDYTLDLTLKVVEE